MWCVGFITYFSGNVSETIHDMYNIITYQFILILKFCEFIFNKYFWYAENFNFLHSDKDLNIIRWSPIQSMDWSNVCLTLQQRLQYKYGYRYIVKLQCLPYLEKKYYTTIHPAFIQEGLQFIGTEHLRVALPEFYLFKFNVDQCCSSFL